MKITDVQVHICEAEERYKGINRMRSCPHGVVGPLKKFALAIIFTDEGINGYYQIRPRDAHAFVDFVKNFLVGADPFDKDRILGRFRPVIRRGGEWFPFYGYPMTIVGYAECCLWDIIGKSLDKPVYRILGQCRDKIPA